MPLLGFILKSKGPSCLKENPRSGLSICIDDTPKSAIIKSKGPDIECKTSISAKLR